MAPTGAHEIVVETPDHTRTLAQMSDEEIERVLEAYAQRIADLKRDARFKYVTVFKNQGAASGRGMAARAFADYGDDFCSAANSVRAARGAGMVSRTRALRFLRHPEAGNSAAESPIVDIVGRLLRILPLCFARPYETWLIPQDAQSSI